MKHVILTLSAFTCIASNLAAQTSTRKGSAVAGQQSTSTARRSVHTGKPPSGPTVFSPAIVAGDLVFTSGQIGVDPKTSQLVEGGFEAQSEQVLRNLASVLEAAGSDMSRVLKTTVFLADMENYNKMNEIYRRHFKEDPPARSTVQVARLPRNAMIEIEAIALVKK
jgi:2-iminobutanoate/2-iminopropanoate deaminase